jgi:hypothetical protein
MRFGCGASYSSMLTASDELGSAGPCSAACEQWKASTKIAEQAAEESLFIVVM